MLQNYFKLAWRNLWKNKAFSVINILGLSVGIAFTLLIGAYIWGQVQVNHQLKNYNNQYILTSRWKDPGQGNEIASAGQMPRALYENYPDLVANYYHFDGVTTNVSKGDMHFRESLQLGDSTFFNMYGFKLLYGDARTALNAPFAVVLTQKAALKYFGRLDVVGQSLNFESFGGEKHDFTISGVLADVPKNSVTNLDQNNNSDFFFTASAARYFKRNLEGWTNFSTVGYIELKDGFTAKDLERPLRELLQKNTSADISKSLTNIAVPLKNYYLDGWGGAVKRMCYTLGYIALFILLMAVINFINICIGRSAGRMKEMGIRKVLGGLRGQLIWQFLTESVLMVLIATIIALVLYALARPYFGDVLGQQITGIFEFPVYFMVIPFLFAVLVGLLAGIYPALVLSALKSIDSLKGKLASVKERVVFRKTLVVFQFGTAAIVFIGALIVSQQITLFFTGKLGYNKDYVVYAQVPRDWSVKGVQKMESVREQLAQMPQVSSVSLSWDIPNGQNGGNYTVYKQGGNPAQSVTATGLMVDNQYAATYGILMRAGIFFKPVFVAADTTQVVINETQAKLMGYKTPEDAIGKKIMQQGSGIPLTICGVTADFQFGSMHELMPPIIYMNVNYTTYYRYFSIKLRPGNMQQSLAVLQKKWAQLLPGAPFEYGFMDDALKKMYQSEIQLKQAAYIATVLAIIIVLLGVLGLISLSIQKRTKEIGIRKVLGSSVVGIISLFMQEFLGVIVVACLVACPLAYWIMSSWLSDYAYRVTISVNSFIIAIAGLTLVTAALISIQTFKAALNNPVKSLKSE